MVSRRVKGGLLVGSILAGGRVVSKIPPTSLLNHARKATHRGLASLRFPRVSGLSALGRSGLAARSHFARFNEDFWRSQLVAWEVQNANQDRASF